MWKSHRDLAEEARGSVDQGLQSQTQPETRAHILSLIENQGPIKLSQT